MFYLGLLLAGIAVVISVQLASQWLGFTMTTQGTAAVEQAKPGAVQVLMHVLVTLSAVILAGALFGKLCSYVGQPPVIGEVLAGLALGPSLLGAISPEAMHALVPAKLGDPAGWVASSLKVIAQLVFCCICFLWD